MRCLDKSSSFHKPATPRIIPSRNTENIWVTSLWWSTSTRPPPERLPMDTKAITAAMMNASEELSAKGSTPLLSVHICKLTAARPPPSAATQHEHNKMLELWRSPTSLGPASPAESLSSLLRASSSAQFSQTRTPEIISHLNVLDSLFFFSPSSWLLKIVLFHCLSRFEGRHGTR